MASVAVASLEAELEKTRSKIGLVQMKEKEAKEKMTKLPKKLQLTVEETNQGKSIATESKGRSRASQGWSKYLGK